MTLDNPQNIAHAKDVHNDGIINTAASAYTAEARMLTGTAGGSSHHATTDVPMLRGTGDIQLCMAVADKPVPTQEDIQHQLDNNRRNTVYRGTDGRWTVTDEFRQLVGRYVLDGAANGWSIVGLGESERRARAEKMINDTLHLTGSDAVHLEVKADDFGRPKVNFIQRGRRTQRVF